MKQLSTQIATIAFASFASMSVASMGSANAAVSTNACAAVDQCSLQELYDGGSIIVDDVTFDGFTFGDDFSEVMLDPNAIIVSGASGLGLAGLTFTFTGGLTADNVNFAIEYLFEFAATVTGSSRTIADVDLEMTDFDLQGAAGEFGFQQVGGVLTGNGGAVDELVEAFVQTDDLAETLELSSTANVGALTALSVAMDFQGEADPSVLATLSQFTFVLGLDGAAPPVPLPGAVLFMASGLIGLGAFRRKRSQQS